VEVKLGKTSYVSIAETQASIGSSK